jgi:hypothetical protein
MGPPPPAIFEPVALKEDEDRIDLASLDWDDREQVTLARSPSTMCAIEEDDGGDAAVTLPQQALSSSEATAVLARSEDSVPSLAALRARVNDSRPPPPASDDERTRPVARSWLSALANERTEPRGHLPAMEKRGSPVGRSSRALKAAPIPPPPPAPRISAPKPLARADVEEGFDARITARKRRVTPLPPSRSSVMQVKSATAEERRKRKDPDASAALPLVRRSVVEARRARTPSGAKPRSARSAPSRSSKPRSRPRSAPPRSAPPPPRTRASSGRWIHQLTSERDDLWREIAQLRRWTRATAVIAVLALLACAVMAAARW